MTLTFDLLTSKSNWYILVPKCIIAVNSAKLFFAVYRTN